MSRLLQIRRLRRQRGVSIITAIFLIVVLAGLATAVVTLSAGQQVSSALDLLGSRAYEAARSGAEYGMYRSMRSGVACNFTDTFKPAAPTLSAFTVTVQCTSTTVTMSNTAVVQRSVTATACSEPASGVCPNPSPTSADYVQRVVSSQF